MQKRTYYIPTIEIVRLHADRIMGIADTSNGHISGGQGQAPRRESGDMKSF